ncbi:ABC transporter ATP-binding protein [Aquabacter sp. CN5-332]|uniref:ABC transporter ATP-binding protein n=1 Tax=Aquabacter sp. CN5-332 TaxID=3156608 RepID=UPI0032B3ACC3
MGYGGENGVLALTETSMKIRKGEFVALVGPSGCGKSSMLKLISGLHPALRGAVKVSGQKVTGPLKICGMAFQNSTLLPWRTTLDNVLLPLEIVEPHAQRFRAHKEEYHARARDLIATVGLSGFENNYPWQLSGGMQQRSSLCRALIHSPEMLLLDEPFGALDPFTREELWDVVQELWLNRRPTVILVTHDLREAVYLADTIYLFSPRPGRIMSRTEVDLPRPRTLADTYTPRFIEMTHALREQIASRPRT